MSCLVRVKSAGDLTPERLEEVLKKIGQALVGRVEKAYVFGSAATGAIRRDSDIDLVLIKNEVSPNFVERPLEFSDLFRIFPNLDLLVYTPDEFEAKLADADLGFWKSLKRSLKPLLEN